MIRNSPPWLKMLMDEAVHCLLFVMRQLVKHLNDYDCLHHWNGKCIGVADIMLNQLATRRIQPCPGQVQHRFGSIDSDNRDIRPSGQQFLLDQSRSDPQIQKGCV